MRACSGIEETNDRARESTCSYMESNHYQSTPSSKGRRRRKAELSPLNIEDAAATTTTPTATSGAPRGRTSSSPESCTLRHAADILREVAASKASKETRRRSEIKQTALRQSKDDDKHGKQQRTRRTLPAIACFYAPMFGVLRDPEKDGWQDGGSKGANLKTGPADVS